MKLSEILKPAKEREADTAIGMVALLFNQDACRMTAAFALMAPPAVLIQPWSRMGKIIDGNLFEECDYVTIFEAIWESTMIDMPELCVRSGIQVVEQGHALFRELRANFVLYPDGTIHSGAREHLEGLTCPKRVGDEEPA